MIYTGLDLSRKRLDYRAAWADGDEVAVGAVPPDHEGLALLVHRLGEHEMPVVAVIESMNGARFVHDQLERAGWDVRIADARRPRRSRPWPARRTASTPGCSRSSPGASWCPRSGCRTRTCVPSASARASGCTWCATEARSRTGSTPP
jgi:hypothetical protein